MPTIAEYRQKLQPAWKKELDDTVEWTLLRPFSIYLSVPMGKMGLQPAHASLLCFLSALTGSLFLATGSLGWVALGAVLIWLSFLLDCVDGELARFHNSGSYRGTYLDFLTGGINDLMIMTGMSCAVALLMGWDIRWLVFLGVFSAGGEKLVDLYGHSLFYRNATKLAADEKWRKTHTNHETLTKPTLTPMQKLIRAPFTMFFRVNVWVLACLLGWLSGLALVLILAYAIWIILSLVYIGHLFRRSFLKGRIEPDIANIIEQLQQDARK